MSALSLADAKALDARVDALVGNAVEVLVDLDAAIAEGKAGDIHIALGFRSWVEWVIVKTEPLRPWLAKLHRDDRRKWVQVLGEAGMSSTGIAGVMDKAPNTIISDIRHLEAQGVELPERVIGPGGRRVRPSGRPRRELVATFATPAKRPKPPPPPTPEELLEAKVERLRERVRGACRDIRSVMSELEDAPLETGGWVSMEIMEAAAELDEVAAEVGKWVDAACNRWDAEDANA